MPVIYQRGMRYFKQGRVKLESVHFDHFTATVRGTFPYTVEGKLVDDRLFITCDCPYWTHCKHEAATLLAVREYLQIHGDQLRKEKTEPPWDIFFNRVLPTSDEQLTHNKTANRWQVAFSLQFFRDNWEFNPQKIYIRKNGTFGRIDPITEIDPTDVRLMYSPNDPLVISYLIQRLSSFNRYHFYYHHRLPYGSEDVGILFDKLKDSLLFIGENGVLGKQIRFSSSPVKIEFDFIDHGDNIQFVPFIQIDGKKKAVDKNYKILTESPTWIFKDNTLYRVNNPVDTKLLIPFTSEQLHVNIPQQDIPYFIEKMYGKLYGSAKINLPPQYKIHTISEIGKKRIYLKEDDRHLQVHLRFCYDQQEFDFFDDTIDCFKSTTSKFKFHKLSRDFKQESDIYNQLLTRGLRKNNNGYLYIVKSRALNWLFENIPWLAKQGFEIYGQEQLNTLKVRVSRPQIQLSVESGTDWFDLNVKIDFDGIMLSLKQLKKELSSNQKYIRLTDGSAAQLSDDWMKKLNYILNVGELNKNKLRLSGSHIPVIDTLLETATSKQTDDVYIQRINRLKNFDGIENYQTPLSLNGTLRSYQREGFNWLNFLREFSFGGCLADDMGLGKTLQALTLLQSEKEKNIKLPSLVVCPTSVVFNWENEVKKFTPDLKLHQHVGIGRDKVPSRFNDYDIVVTSYGILLRDIVMLKDFKFHYVILDESQKIKNPSAKTAKAARLLQANHRFVMTGTPIENNTLELWSQFTFLNPGLLGSLNFFKKSFAKPIEKGKDEESARLLRKMIYPFILRRTKESVAKELPPKSEQIYYCDMSNSQEKMYNKWRDYYRAMILGKIADIGLDKSRMNVLQGLVKLRQIACHPNLVDVTVWEDSGKYEALKEILEEVISGNHKVLIFSQFVKMLKLIRKYFDEQNICYEYLDGHTRDRKQCVDRFQNDNNIKIFLLSLKAGGTGINLTAADYVIHYDPWWNPAVEMQATDRTHRIGQDKNVFVYRMITKGTVEEKILELQRKKTELVSNLITTDSSFFKSLTREDIDVLFS